MTLTDRPFLTLFFITQLLGPGLPAKARAQVVAKPGAAEVRTFRTWIGGQEAGGSERRTSTGPDGVRIERHEWTRLERQGVPVVQDLTETALRRPDGSIQFTFTVTLSQEPLAGQASWTPAEPGKLKVTYRNLPPKVVDLPPGTILWPGDEDDLMKQGARQRRPIHVKGYDVATLQASNLDLDPVGPEPVPGYPGTMKYKGKSLEGTLAEDVEVWISPDQADVKNLGSFAGVTLVEQRAELPAPVATGKAGGFFERTLKTLPPHPFLPWVQDVEVRWTGKGVQQVPEDPQQRRTGENRYVLTQAARPSAGAMAELPVAGKPSAEDAPFLAETPLVQFRDPVFEGLMKRLAAPAGATRWELAMRVTAFVYDWIQEKDYTVGFASAQEVARTPRGDCTEHGVLAVALLRRLGVPARGVVGWVAMDDAMGLHFWAEALIGGRWLPIDPTFDQVPASAFRIKLGTTDLANLGTVGWDDAASTFQEGSWVPGAPWSAAIRVQGDTAYAPGAALRLPGAAWTCEGGVLSLNGTHRVTASPRPEPAQHVRLLQGRKGRRGWLGTAGFWVDCEDGRWLRVSGLTEPEAFRLLDGLEVQRHQP